MLLSTRLARMLEEGPARGALDSASPRSLASRALAKTWGACVRVPRPLRLPRDRAVVCVGGATLGGSGKTPLALAYAVALSSVSGGDVVIVGHAYAARPCVARFVAPNDDVRVVGDEALACARALAMRAGVRVRVVVAPKRQAAIDFAAAHARVLVVDGAAQTSPVRATLALLALDAHAPWGSDALPPRGDLRATREALIDACDEIFILRDALDPVPPRITPTPHKPVHIVSVDGRGAFHRGELLSWRELRSLRVGLVTAIARPARVLAWLERRGVTPRIVEAGANHRPPRAPTPTPSQRLSRGAVDVWLATSKCATHLADEREGVPVAALEHVAGLTGQACGNILEKPGPRRPPSSNTIELASRSSNDS
jgi:tetraacyldisaccharide-1-P 4'-kinase